MQAILDEWPTCRMIVMHGPYRSAPEPRPYEVSMDQVGGADGYELDAPFFVGMAEVAAPGQVVMGASSVVPEELGAIWPTQVGVTHGLYNETWPTPDDLMTPAIMRTALEQALRQGGRGRGSSPRAPRPGSTPVACPRTGGRRSPTPPSRRAFLRAEAMSTATGSSRSRT